MFRKLKIRFGKSNWQYYNKKIKSRRKKKKNSNCKRGFFWMGNRSYWGFIGWVETRICRQGLIERHWFGWSCQTTQFSKLIYDKL